MTATGDNLAVAESATPIRTCVGCRVRRGQHSMVRLMRRDDGRVVAANITRETHGRTAYLCPRRACLDQAVKRRAFARAFSTGRRRVSVIDVDSNALWDATAEQLRCEIELLGRSSENPHAHPRRRGLEQLLSELSSPPQNPLESSSIQPHNIGAANDESEGGAPSHG
jgi:predicted RNA-binding protein YlxR (DUF448 family)